MQAEGAMMTEGQEPPDDGLEDRRTGARQISVLINAGLSHDGDDALCRIRNLSSGGVMIESPLPLAANDPVELHLRSGRQVSGTVRWTQDGRAGIAFDDPASADLVSAPQQAVPRRISIRRQTSEVSPIGYPVFRRRSWALLSAGKMRAQAPVVQISSTGLVVENIVSWNGERLFGVTIEGLGRYSARLADPSAVEHAETVALIFVEPLLYRAFNEWLMISPRLSDADPATLRPGTAPREWA